MLSSAQTQGAWRSLLYSPPVTVQASLDWNCCDDDGGAGRGGWKSCGLGNMVQYVWGCFLIYKMGHNINSTKPTGFLEALNKERHVSHLAWKWVHCDCPVRCHHCQKMKNNNKKNQTQPSKFDDLIGFIKRFMIWAAAQPTSRGEHQERKGF